MAQLQAWVDESGSDRARDPHTYILAAALCAADAVEEVRAVMATLRAPGTPKLHWRDDTKPARRAAITAAVAACEALEHLVVVRAGVASDTRQRPRAVTLQRLLLELDARRVTRAVFESRGRVDDGRDLAVMRHLRDRRQVISPRLKVDHAPGPSDAGLWVADAVCGAVSAARTGQPAYLEQLAGRITVVEIDLRGETASTPGEGRAT